MTFVGCDLHSRNQQVAVLDTDTGEVQERGSLTMIRRSSILCSLPRPVTVGVESTGYAQWFHALIQRQGHTLLVGDAARIRAMVVRKTKTDRRDAAHLLQLVAIVASEVSRITTSPVSIRRRRHVVCGMPERGPEVTNGSMPTYSLPAFIGGGHDGRGDVVLRGAGAGRLEAGLHAGVVGAGGLLHLPELERRFHAAQLLDQPRGVEQRAELLHQALVEIDGQEPARSGRWPRACPSSPRAASLPRPRRPGSRRPGSR